MKGRQPTHAIRQAVAGAALVLALLPVGAGGFRAGDRDGPIFYPPEIHAFLYRVGWEFARNSQVDGKPRVHYCRRWNWRPWFYGLRSKNERIQYWISRVDPSRTLDEWERCSLAMAEVEREP